MVEALEVTGRIFWRLVLIFIFLTTSFVLLLISGEKSYESRTLLLFKLGREYIYVPEIEEAGARAPDPGDFEFAVNAETLILNGRTIKAEVVERFGPEVIYPDLVGDPEAHEKAIAALEGAVSISLVTGSYVVQLAVSHRDPEMAARLANELVAVYLSRREGIFRNVDPARLQARMNEVRDRISGLEIDLAELIDDGDVLSFEADGQTRVLENQRLREELLETQLRITALDRQDSLVAADLAELQPVVVDQRDDGPNPTVRSAEATILTLRARARALVSQFGQSHPDVIALEREIEELETLVASQPEEVRMVTRTTSNPLYTQAQAMGFDLRLARAEYGARLDYLEERLAENERLMAESAKSASSVELVLDKLAIQRTQYSELYGRLQQAESSELAGDGQNNIRILESATPPLTSAGAPNSVKAVLAALIAGVVTIAFLAIRIVTNGTLLSATGLRSRLNIPVLGEIERRRAQLGA